MTNRERFLRAMSFEPVDHPPLMLSGPWPETHRRWVEEGLPPKVSLYEYFDLEPFEMVNVSPETRIFPPFEPKVHEETGEYVIKTNTRGVKVKMRKEASDAGAEHYLEYPIKGRADMAWLGERLEPANPGRLRNGWDERLRKTLDSPHVVRLVDFGSFFGDLHEHAGTVRTCMLFVDEPDFVHWYNDRIAALCEQAIRTVLPGGGVDFMGGHEDMAYKNGPLISPAMFREFLMPYYARTVGLARSYGQKLFLMDSDGDIRRLIPLWLEVGVNAFTPMEVAAGMDVRSIRKEYGREVRMIGGLDKRKFAESKDAIKAEVLAKVPVAHDGGYIPTVDHGVPPDVPFAHYAYFVELMKGVYGM